jgi:hypothetical protein
MNRPGDLNDSRWGQSHDLQAIRSSLGSALPFTLGASTDLASDFPHDWTVYVERGGPGGPVGVYEVEIAWGSGGALNRERFPLALGARFVLHYVSAMPPQVLVRNVGIETAPQTGPDICTVTCAPGRPTRHVISYAVQAQGFEEPFEGSWIAAVDVPFGAERMWAQGYAFGPNPPRYQTRNTSVGLHIPGSAPTPFPMMGLGFGGVNADGNNPNLDLNMVKPWPIGSWFPQRQMTVALERLETDITGWVWLWWEVCK